MKATASAHEAMAAPLGGVSIRSNCPPNVLLTGMMKEIRPTWEFNHYQLAGA